MMQAIFSEAEDKMKKKKRRRFYGRILPPCGPAGLPRPCSIKSRWNTTAR